MGSKLRPGAHDCYKNALPDEPMFVLLARDPDAPRLVREWAAERRSLITMGKKPDSDLALTKEARECADVMEKWREENDGRWREPQPQQNDVLSLAAYVSPDDAELDREGFLQSVAHRILEDLGHLPDGGAR